MRHYQLTYFEKIDGRKIQRSETYFSRAVAEFVAKIYGRQVKYSNIKIFKKS